MAIGWDARKSLRRSPGRGGRLPDGRPLPLGVEDPFRPSRKAHPAFEAKDLEGLAERLTPHGHPVHWDEGVPGVRRFYTWDPFGNRREFMERASASPVDGLEG